MKTNLLITSLLLVATLSSYAAPQLRLSDGTTTVTVADGDPNDQSSDPGVVFYNGPIGANWIVNVTVGTSKPAVGTPSEPFIDLDTTSLSQSAGNLTIEFTDTDFTATSGTWDAEAGGTSDGSVEFKYFLDGSNAPFGTNSLLADFPDQLDVYAASSNGTFTINAPYSMTVQALIHHTGRGNTGFDAMLQLTPPQRQPPTIECAGDRDLGCNPTNIPACDTSSIAVNASCGVSNITCGASGPDTVTGCVHERDYVYVVTDNCGQTATCTQHIYWTEDKTPPTFTCPSNIDLGCNPTSIPDCDLSQISATDDCGRAIVTCSSVDSSDGCGRRRVITYTVTDSCGNSATCAQTITWSEDHTPPVITCPPAKTTNCLPFCTFHRTNWCQWNGGNNGCWYLNNCFYQIYGYNGCQIGGQNGGHYLRCTSADFCRTGCTFGGTPAKLNCDYVNTSGCSAGSFASQCLALKLNVDFCDWGARWGLCAPLGDCVLHDDSSPCDGRKVRDILDICDKAVGGCDISSYRCTISHLNDLCDKINKCCDSWKPTSWATCHLLPTTCTNNTGRATAVDDCDPNPTITYTDVVSSGDCASSTVVTRIWTATDKCGNSSSCSQVISSTSDKTPPKFTKCASDVYLGCNPTTIPTCDISQVTAVDNCGTPTITCSSNDSVSWCNHVRTITYTATDGNGNKATCVQHIYWTENTNPPKITKPCDITVYTWWGNSCSVSFPNPVCTASYGNCNVTCSPRSGSYFCKGTNTVTCTATDSCGNQSTCTFRVCVK